MRRKVLGSIFGLATPEPGVSIVPDFLTSSPHCFANARSALRVLARELSPDQIWIPSFLCPTLVTALRSETAVIRYYDVGDGFAAVDSTWQKQVRRGDLLLFIDYFGFPFFRSSVDEAISRGCVVIEDASQALLSEGLGEEAHFLVFSPRKFVGVPDGGILKALGETAFAPPPFDPPPEDWWRDALHASSLRAEFDRSGGNRDWYPVSQSAESRQPLGPFPMSGLTRTLLECAFDYRDIAERRVANYRLLLDELGDLALFKHLPERVVPLGFPIRTSNRDEVRDSLFAEEIFPAVHWPIVNVVPSEFESSHRLATEILTLPSDHRCDSADLRRMAALVRKVARR